MSLRQPSDRRSGRRSRDPSPEDYDRYERRYDEPDDPRGYLPDPRDRDDDLRYAPREPKYAEPPYAGKRTATFAMPGGFDENKDPLAYGDRGRGSGMRDESPQYKTQKFAEPSKKYYDDKYERQRSREPSRDRRQPNREPSRDGRTKQYYDDDRRYEEAPRESKKYYDDDRSPLRKYESSPKPKYAEPVRETVTRYAVSPAPAPSTKYATAGGIMGGNPKYNSSEGSDSESDSDDGKDGATGERELDIEIEFGGNGKNKTEVRKRSRKTKVEEINHAPVTTTTTTNNQSSRYESVAGQYSCPDPYQYASPPDRISYSSWPVSAAVTADYRPRYDDKYDDRPQYASRPHETRITTVASSNGPKKTEVVTVEPGHRRNQSSLGTTLGAPLGVAGGYVAGSLSQAPGSPVLEAYKGTYQNIGPMPSPLMMPSKGYAAADQQIAILDLSHREPSPSRKKKARFHDLAADATLLRIALRDNGKKSSVDPENFIRVLPPLSHEQIMELRVEYKKQVKTPDMKGVNVAKHIKVRLKEDKNFLKACYTTALGEWESEGYWANSYYQGEKSSRELIIESLMGRSNAEIKQIKDVFRDKKYSDDLMKAIKRELKEDKFKMAIMLVLEEGRMEEPRSRYDIDSRLITQDVDDLHRAVRSERGGETAMIQICVSRSDAHLKEVLKEYERKFRQNFAKEMLRKCGNLVVSCPS